MKRTYRKSQKEFRGRRVSVVDRAEELSGSVGVELPVWLAEVVERLSEDVERLAGEVGLRLMDVVIEAECRLVGGPKRPT